MVICQCLANYSCLLLNRHCLFFFLSFVPDTSTGSFCSLPASEISNRKQNATLRSEPRGGHLWAGNVYDCCPSTFCGRLFLNYMCARANCGWWSGTNSKINEPHSELYSLWNGLITMCLPSRNATFVYARSEAVRSWKIEIQGRLSEF